MTLRDYVEDYVGNIIEELEKKEALKADEMDSYYKLNSLEADDFTEIANVILNTNPHLAEKDDNKGFIEGEVDYLVGEAVTNYTDGFKVTVNKR